MNNKLPSFLLLLLFFLVSPNITAQNAQEEAQFKEKIDQIYNNLPTSNIDDVLIVVDSLIDVAKKREYPIQYIHALILKATVYDRKGDLSKVIYYTDEAYKIAEKNKNYEWQARITGMLADHYRLLDMLHEGLRYLDKANAMLPKIEDDNVRNLFYAFLLQERVRYNSALGEYDHSLEQLEQALDYIKAIDDSPNKTLFISDNYTLKGQTLLEMRKWKEAVNCFAEAERILLENGIEDDVNMTFLYLGYSSGYLEMNELDKAFENIIKADKLISNFGFLFLQVDLAKRYSEYYKKTEELDSFQVYNIEYKRLLKEKESEKSKRIKDFVSNSQDDYQKAGKKKGKLYLCHYCHLYRYSYPDFPNVRKKKKIK